MPSQHQRFQRHQKHQLHLKLQEHHKLKLSQRKHPQLQQCLKPQQPAKHPLQVKLARYLLPALHLEPFQQHLKHQLHQK